MKLLVNTIFQAGAMAAGMLSSAAVMAADGAPQMQVVQVSGMRNIDERSYPKIIKGMDLFEKLHGAMAPNAALQFELQPVRAKVSMKGLTLRIAGKEGDVPLALGANMTFTVPRLPRMLADKATVSTNRRNDSLMWRARIRTPGLPANTRRLGDLRLEWHVDYVAGLGRHWLSPGSELVMAAMDRPYELRGLHHVFLADRPLFGVTLIQGNRRQVIGVDKLYMTDLTAALPSFVLAFWKDRDFLKDRAFDLPLSDTSWPDDTLVVIDYMDN